MAKPITPKEVIPEALKNIPDTVIEIFNRLIVKNFHQGYSTIKQDEVADLIASTLMISRDEIFNRHYLDIEPFFRDAGWIVEYNKPSFDDNWDAFFRFSYVEVK